MPELEKIIASISGYYVGLNYCDMNDVYYEEPKALTYKREKIEVNNLKINKVCFRNFENIRDIRGFFISMNKYDDPIIYWNSIDTCPTITVGWCYGHRKTSLTIDLDRDIRNLSSLPNKLMNTIKKERKFNMRNYNVYQNEGSYIVIVDMLGYTKDEISIVYENKNQKKYLVIKTTKKFNKEIEDIDFYDCTREDIKKEKFEQYIPLCEDLEESFTEAIIKNGMVKIKFTKKETGIPIPITDDTPIPKF